MIGKIGGHAVRMESRQENASDAPSSAKRKQAWSGFGKFQMVIRRENCNECFKCTVSFLAGQIESKGIFAGFLWDHSLFSL
ncbi:hypothetical protein ACCD06_17270 [Azospirillum sp. CT11-132]|uniref:hypothetical protein n=1 Tax=Azospirillum sp. CT11-132 TaxID=3396317 RepID=UPI0039A42517